MIYIASDHGGIKLKNQLVKYLSDKHNIAIKDLGPKVVKESDDYPDYAFKVASKISKKPLADVGILLCRSGQGMAIAANKVKNIRAAVIWNVDQASLSRNDDMSNILCLPSDFINFTQAQHIVNTWLNTPYSQDHRHIRRIKKISDYENR